METNIKNFSLSEKLEISNNICDELRSATGRIYEKYLLTNENVNSEAINTKDLIEIIFNGLGKYMLFTVESINSEFAKNPGEQAIDHLLNVFITNLFALQQMRQNHTQEKTKKH